MIYRNIEGLLIEINKNNYKNDNLFYKKIMEIKIPFSKYPNVNNTNKNSYTNLLIDKLIS
jgi:hypothetical protein